MKSETKNPPILAFFTDETIQEQSKQTDVTLNSRWLFSSKTIIDIFVNGLSNGFIWTTRQIQWALYNIAAEFESKVGEDCHTSGDVSSIAKTRNQRTLHRILYLKWPASLAKQTSGKGNASYKRWEKVNS